jgi:hypothetical protein
VIKKPREQGGHRPRWAAEPEIIIIIIIIQVFIMIFFFFVQRKFFMNILTVDVFRRFACLCGRKILCERLKSSAISVDYDISHRISLENNDFRFSSQNRYRLYVK